MIIRRRHTKNFVTLENALVRDRRLSLDEHGMLHYLLSLPDDWEVSRANCAKFWGIGREKAGRIFRSLCKTGWAKVERLHGEDGTFLGTRWIITDDPGEEVSEVDLQDEADAEDEPAEVVGEGSEPNHDTALPEDGSTVVRVNRSTANPYHGEYIDSKKTDSEENRLPQSGAGEIDQKAGEASFTPLLKLWPPDHVLSRVAAEQAWQRLGRSARQSAQDVALRYLDDCRRNARKVCDLTTYLREARFERFGATALGGAPVIAKPHSPQWYRWKEYFEATGQSTKFMEAQAAKGVGWTTQREWPPPLPPKADAPATQPSTLTDDDIEALANEGTR